MDMKKKLIYLFSMLTATLFFACSNGDWEFPDNDHTAVYFSYQSPIRTITLGWENPNVTDNTMDNQHQCQIMATFAGVYENNKDVKIAFQVDNSLVDGYQFVGGGDIVAMPASYYTLSSNNQIVIPSGKVLGGVTVQLTDAFFADPLSTTLHYVIPVVMTGVEGADSINQGKPQDGVTAPSRMEANDWSVLPKDYILYAVKYISPYQANYLRRGVDNYSGAKTGMEVRHAAYVEKDEVLQDQFTTLGINSVEWARPAKDLEGNNVDCRLKLDFDASGNCTISSNSEDVTASGSGKYVSSGDKNSWGGKDRDVLYLDYTVDYAGIQCATKDTLVVRDRGVIADWFKVEKKQ
jgi:hypothetical protein